MSEGGSTVVVFHLPRSSFWSPWSFSAPPPREVSESSEAPAKEAEPDTQSAMAQEPASEAKPANGSGGLEEVRPLGGAGETCAGSLPGWLKREMGIQVQPPTPKPASLLLVLPRSPAPSQDVDACLVLKLS